MNIILGDCLEEMAKMADNSIDFIVTDPPYGLNFMGKDWDSSVPNTDIWKEALRICKPGAMLAAFGGSRTHHHLMVALEMAGWEIRDVIMWLYGQGFPKSHNFGCKCKGIPVPYNHENTTEKKAKSCMRSVSNTDLSQTFSNSSSENETLFESLQEQNLQSLWFMPSQGNEIRQESSLEGRNNLQEDKGELHRPEICQMSIGMDSNGKEGRIYNGTSFGNGDISESNTSASGSGSSQRSQYTKQSNRQSGTFREQSIPQDRRGQTCESCKGIIGLEGYGTALKPAYEPIILAMKPLDGTYAQNVEKWGLGGINIDESRIGIEERINNPSSNQDREKWRMNNGAEAKSCIGRWPANIILDEEAGKMLDEQSGISKSTTNQRNNNPSKNKCMSGANMGHISHGHNDSGGASRFFYCAKASSKERNKGLEGMKLKENMRVNAPRENEEKKHANKMGNHHPTVKPISLMKYIIKLLAPPGNPILLDPFAGSGSTLLAAKELDIQAIGIEKQEDYCEIARKRIESVELDLFASYS